MNKIIDFIGYHAPIILVLFTIRELWKQPPFLYGYLVFTILCIISNQLFKIIIKDPRPIYDNYNGKIHTYGMPSGHLQMLLFTTSFLYLVKQNLYVGLFCLSLSILAFYTLYVDRIHSFQQLLVGSLVGLIFGYISYLFTEDSIRKSIF